MAETRQPSSDPIRQLIINSLFPEVAEDPSQGNSFAGESLIIHLKISEDSTGTGPITINERQGTIGKKGAFKSLAFIMTINKPYLWTADTQRERNLFLATLLKVYKTNIKRLPKLINFDDSSVSETKVQPTFVSQIDTENSLQGRLTNANKSTSSLNQKKDRIPQAGGLKNDSNGIVQHKAEDEDVKQEEISLINVSELLNDFDWKGSGNAAALEERLLNELAALEAANIHAMVESDDRVNSVIEQIDKAINELDNMDSWLSIYAAELNSMGDEDIHHIESQNRGLQVQTANQKALLSELDRLIQIISIPDQVIKILRQESMDTPQGVQNIEQAAEQLKHAIETPFDKSLQEMKAIQEKIESYKYHAKNFCSRFGEYMRMMFQFQTETLMNDKSRGPRHNNLTIQSHDYITNNLSKYCTLSLWVKEMDPNRHLEVQSLYVAAKEPIYKKETKEYLQQMSAANAYSNRSSLFSFDSTKQALEFRDNNNNSGKIPLEESFNHCLRTIIPLISNEQKFMADFFNLDKKDSKSSFNDSEVFLKDLDDDEDEIMHKKLLYEHMEKLFNFLPDELCAFIDYGCKLDAAIQIVGIIVSIEKLIQEEERPNFNYVIKVFRDVRKHCLEILDRFINDQLKAIEDTKVTSKRRKGIVLFIRIFPRFVERIEHAMNGADKLEIRNIVNSGYEKIVKMMFDCLEAISKDEESTDDREQLNAHIMTLEIRTRKIIVLDPFMRYARTSYDKHLEAYAKSVVRRPFGKLLEFFEGIESLLRTTSAPEEVGFRLKYSKDALKKVVSQYPGKEIRKDMISLYKRVDKHFTEEEGLLQVVWRSIEEEVIRCHERFTSIINKCYPDSNISLEFSIDDLLNYFSELARSH
ncbi:exocyst complex component Sec3-domain-containing protein [Gigaspora rosea]|uniref:Exocyst complex component Sec3-domain-containing protein n=1 Tax=Gigaspora rosea TaxID=44941 RepID=A0A397UCD0_9GLOM|nr:exocyst complex component Sec3-domain-containing protein [Gigaspora rosea]